jgi:hypothetical protein
MTSTYPIGTLGSVASLLAATFYQGYPDRNRKLWNIVSTKRYTPYAGAAEKKKTHWRNSSKIQQKNHRNRQNHSVHYNIFNMVVGYNLF